MNFVKRKVYEMRIILWDLPEKEIAYIKENCREQMETGELSFEIYDEIAEGTITEINGEEGNKVIDKAETNDSSCMLISQNKRLLQNAIDADITTIAYQHPDGERCNLSVDIVVEGFEEVDFLFLQRIWQRHHKIPWTILETERLLVRELTLADIDDLFELYSYEGMTDYMEGLYPYEEEYAYQKAYIESMYGFFGYGMWLVFEKKTGKLVGRAGVEHREELDGELELGYAIGTPWQGQGFATEVCEGILKYVQEELYFEEIVSLVEPANQASVHLLKKLGFFMEKELELDGIHYKKYKKCLKPL